MLTMLSVTAFKKRALIAAAAPHLHFERITILLYIDNGEEVEELSPQLGLMISGYSLPPTFVAGNRIANAKEVWLYPDGTLHEYLWTATWNDVAFGCSQRHYVGAADDEAISLEDLQEQIEINLLADKDSGEADDV